MTHQRGVVKEGFTGLIGVLMMKDAASTNSKILSLIGAHEAALIDCTSMARRQMHNLG